MDGVDRSVGRPRWRVPERVTDGLEKLLFAWFALTMVGIVWDQILLLPPRPPTLLETMAATPKARADWAAVHARLARRLRTPDPELGEVWATRTGRICGLVNRPIAAVDEMVPFYTIAGAPVLQYDDQRQYMRLWFECIRDRWVELHVGSEQPGYCGSRHALSTVIGPLICGKTSP